MCLQILYDRFYLIFNVFPLLFCYSGNISWATVHIYTCVCQSVHFLGGGGGSPCAHCGPVRTCSLGNPHPDLFTLVHNVVHIPLFASGPLAFNWKAFLSDHSIGASFSLWTGIPLNLPEIWKGNIWRQNTSHPYYLYRVTLKLQKKKTKTIWTIFENLSVYGTKKPY